MAEYDTGYDDERFEQIVSQTLHCIICTNVIKDPVMCPQNEHLFCRACITRSLMNTQSCPTCIQPLTVETLRPASRTVTNLLAELKIRCEFCDRGCGKFVDVGSLEKHVADCGFAPAVCSNEGCQLEVNKQDLLHHETAVCELRRVQCHSCNDIRREMDTVKVNLAAINEKLVGIEEKFVAELVQVQQSNCRLEADNLEIKKGLSEITKQLERMARKRSFEIHANETKSDEDEPSAVFSPSLSPPATSSSDEGGPALESRGARASLKSRRGRGRSESRRDWGRVVTRSWQSGRHGDDWGSKLSPSDWATESRGGWAT